MTAASGSCSLGAAIGHADAKSPGPFRQVESLILVAALALVALLPMGEVVTRALSLPWISGTSAITQHLVLAIGLLGGALAARDGRLLSLAVASQYFKGRLLAAARNLSSVVGAVVSAFLSLASWQFVAGQRELGRELAYGIPVWTIQLVLVAGFAVIGVRLLITAADDNRGRLVATAGALLLATFVLTTSIDPGALRWPLLAALAAAIVCGAPIYTALGGAALVLVWSTGDSIAPIPLVHYKLAVDASLPTIPLFTLAGFFLADGGAAARLVRLFQALVGGVRGGPAIITALVCAFFTSFTGASGVTILALGGVLMPILAAAKYPDRPALGLLTGAGSLGMLFPPCLPPMLYAIVASSGGQTSVSFQDIFLGGLIPGLLLVGMTAWWGVRQGPRVDAATRVFSWREVRAAAWVAKWELFAPVVAIGALFGGFATPAEAAALTAVYAFIVSFVIWRDLKKWSDVSRVMTECGILVGGVILILGVAMGFTYYLVSAQIPDQVVEWATTSIHSKWLLLLGLNVLLVLIGGLIEIYAAIIVVVPLLVPLGIAYGINPIHLGIIFLANMELGFLAPPIGLNLLLSSYRFNRPVLEVTRSVLPILAVLFVGVLLITYVPALTTFLPGLFH